MNKITTIVSGFLIAASAFAVQAQSGYYNNQIYTQTYEPTWSATTIVSDFVYAGKNLVGSLIQSTQDSLRNARYVNQNTYYGGNNVTMTFSPLENHTVNANVIVRPASIKPVPFPVRYEYDLIPVNYYHPNTITDFPYTNFGYTGNTYQAYNYNQQGIYYAPTTYTAYRPTVDSWNTQCSYQGTGRYVWNGYSNVEELVNVCR